MTNNNAELTTTLKQAYDKMRIDYICKKEITDLFYQEHNAGVYYQKLLSTYLYRSNKNMLIDAQGGFIYETTQAVQDLNLSQKQITACRKNLVDKGWIFIQKKWVNKKMRHVIYINLEKLQNELYTSGVLTRLLMK